jgi:hypothetical protein
MICKNKRKIAVMTTVVTVTRITTDVIRSFLYFDLGRYRIKPILSPREVKLQTNVIREIRAVEMPTEEIGYSLATISQKPNPNTDITKVLAIIKIEF